jgi:hypothetical protein
MEANELRRTCLALLIVTLLFTAMFANAAERCTTSSSRFERPSEQGKGGTTALSEAAAATGRADRALTGQPISGYLALHCEALSKLPLGPAVRAYDGCADRSALR